MPRKKTKSLVSVSGKKIATISNVPKQQAAGVLPSLYDYRNIGRFTRQIYSIQGNEKGIDKNSREQVVALSRTLFAQFPIFNVASEFKSHWVVGDKWDLEYIGNNPSWGKQAEDWFNKVWVNRCSNRGYNYDFKTFIKLMSQTIDVDGDFLVILTKDENNFPILQVVTTDRVTDAVTTKSKVTYNNVEYTYQDGILFNDAGKPCFYAVKENDDSYKYIDVKNAKLVFNPQFFDKHRGLPALYAGTLYGLNLQELDSFTMEALKLESVVAVTETNDSGEAPQEFSNLLSSIGDGSVPISPSTNDVALGGVELINGATNRYLKAGNDIKSFRSQRPSEEIQSYMTKVETALLTTIGYPHQLLYSPDKISGRAVDAIVEFVRKSVRARQALIYKHVKFFAAWAISNAVANGDLPPTNENIYNVIDFSMPEQYTLNKKQDRESDNEDFKLGVMTLQDIIEKNGGNYDKTVSDRYSETITLLNQVTELYKLYPTVSIEVILNLLSQRGQSTIAIKPTDTSAKDE